MSSKLRILWLSNAVFSVDKTVSTGTWMHSMSEALMNTGEVELFNITEGNSDKFISMDVNGIKQWLVPKKKLRQNGLPQTEVIKGIQNIINEISPDIIHVWGTENYWGLLHSRNLLGSQYNALLEIQGLKFAIAKYFYNSLSLGDILRCFRLKEFLLPSRFLSGQKKAFERWGIFEKEMLRNFKYISTQSEWVRANVKIINKNAILVKTKIALRDEFLTSEKWHKDRAVPFRIFTSSSSSSHSYKGLHLLIDALALIRDKFPDVTLHIAGHMETGIRMDGYSKFLQDKIKFHKLENQIRWLGPMNADYIISELKQASAVVIPSFIETYCVALDEALTIGVPTVVSFSGAMPELAVHRYSALYYPAGDIEMCVNAIESIFNDTDFASLLSYNAIKSKETKNNAEIGSKQLSIYKKILIGN